MLRRIVAVCAIATCLVAGKFEKLSDAERDYYRALRVFMSDKDSKRWLRLKTPEDRRDWLVERGLWDRFDRHDENVRRQIVEGDVRVGWSEEMVYMAWGAPFQRQRATGRQAERSTILVYRFEVDDEGYASPVVGKKADYKAVYRYQVDVFIDDGVVTEMPEKKGWE